MERATQAPKISSDIFKYPPIIGKSIIAKILNIKIILIDKNKYFDFTLIKVETAAIAVMPHIAVPEIIKIISFLFNLKSLEIKNPKVIINRNWIAIAGS